MLLRLNWNLRQKIKVLLIGNSDKIGTIFIIDFGNKILNKITNSLNLPCIKIIINLKN